MMMSAIGGGLYFGQAKGFYIGGAVVLAILAALATLEGALNFCMGCWMFSMAQRFSTHSLLGEKCCLFSDLPPFLRFRESALSAIATYENPSLHRQPSLTLRRSARYRRLDRARDGPL